jgi:hypothetical protein
MVQLTIRGRIERPPRHVWAAEHSFPSPVGSWTARFHDSFEWHMGADGWHLSLIHQGKDVTSRHRHIAAMRTQKGFRLPSQYQPWCSSLPLIALHAWENVVHFYDVADHRSSERPIQFPVGLQWAPKGEKLAVTVEGGVTVLDAKGDGFYVPIRHPRYVYPDVFWWPDGTRFFAVNRESSDAKTKLSFFDATHGILLAIVDFDPSDLVPYDDGAYRKVSRTGYSLHIGPGTGAVGSLLDTWSTLEFDLETQLLRAMVYRPIGPCDETDGRYTCPAEERGVEVAVSA